MKSDVLRRANLSVREKRPFFSNERICDVFCSGNLIEIGFLSRRCSRDLQGSCMMCDYGSVQDTHPVKVYLHEMDRILNAVDPAVNILLLCTNGSFLDNRQIEPELFYAVLERAEQCQIPVVEVETHYQDVTEEKLKLLKQLLPGKDIVIEMGLETIQHRYQKSVIMKDIDLAAYERTIRLIQSFGFQVDTNIMVGLPFLSPKEQVEDALNTIRWSFSHGARPVLFPINIKPYTLLMAAYHAGFYRPVSQWLLPLLLDMLPEKWLGQITVAWYGNREEIYDINGERVIFPSACPACSVNIKRFYDELPNISDGTERKERLRQLLSGSNCYCLSQTRREIFQEPEDTFEKRYATFLAWLEKQNLNVRR